MFLRYNFSFLDYGALSTWNYAAEALEDANERPATDKTAKGLSVVMMAKAGRACLAEFPLSPIRPDKLSRAGLPFRSDPSVGHDCTLPVQEDLAGRAIRKRHELLSMMEMAFYTVLESLE